MKRRTKNKRVEKFLDEIIEVCIKHKLSIGHEDFQGAFLIENYKERNIKWLCDAFDDEIIEDKPGITKVTLTVPKTVRFYLRDSLYGHWNNQDCHGRIFIDMKGDFSAKLIKAMCIEGFWDDEHQKFWPPQSIVYAEIMEDK